MIRIPINPPHVTRAQALAGSRFAAYAMAVLLRLGATPSPAQVLPGHRAGFHAWRHSGAVMPVQTPDRIVNVREFGATGEGKVNDRPAVVAAINALSGAPGMVYFPAGIYRISSAIELPAGTVLRGERPANTALVFDFVTHAIQINGSLSGDWIPLTAGAPMHAGSIDLAGGHGLVPGDYALLRQENDPAWGITDTWAAYSVGQIVRITVVADNRIGLESPLRHDYPLERVPEIRRMRPNIGSGVENIRLERLLAGTGPQRQ